ncbi:Peptidyl-prolyl cis-trans isomerase cyp15, partial [Coemansia erecta]
PTREEASLAVASKKKKIARSAVLRTTLGDIHLSLFPELAPKAVESFAVHSQNGYYNGVIFHRVIKRFMIQTGDPLGDGTGGESIWKMPFEDEFTPKLRHDRPYTLSMANAGPGTNGSQFFITTVDSAPWLDDKHTIFGRVKAGADVVHAIESAKTDKNDKPFDDISIMNIQINYD